MPTRTLAEDVGATHAGDPTAAGGGGKPVCLFAQYDPWGRVPAHTLDYLRQLAGCGFALHVACSGSVPAAADLAAVAAVGGQVHLRANAGLDFGAWAELLRAGCAQGAGAVLFANDSVFGPFGPLSPILARMAAAGLDAWGMVESNERVWHLQSWFVWMRRAVLEAAPVRRVFAQDFAAMGKEEVILHGELGLGVALRETGLAVGSVWGPPERWRRLMPVNPSHFDWRGMLTSGRVPFLKAELVRDNPANIGWIGQWPGVVDGLPGGSAAAVAAALAEYAGRDGGWVTPRHGAPLIRRLLNILLTRDRAAALRG